MKKGGCKCQAFTSAFFKNLYPRLTRANTPQNVRKDVLAAFSGSECGSMPSPCGLAIPSFLKRWGSKKFFRGGKCILTRQTTQLYFRKARRITQSGALPVLQNRVCLCQSRVERIKTNKYEPNHLNRYGRII